MIDAVDVDLNDFFNFLQDHVDGGLDNVWVSLTGDHGVAPSPSVAAGERMPPASFSSGALNAELDRELSKKFSPNEPLKFILGGELPYIQLDPRTFSRFSVNEADAETLVAKIVPDALDATQSALLKAIPSSRTLRPTTLRRVYTRYKSPPETCLIRKRATSFCIATPPTVVGGLARDVPDVRLCLLGNHPLQPGHVPLASSGRPLRQEPICNGRLRWT